jgi:hypothetical protein
VDVKKGPRQARVAYSRVGGLQVFYDDAAAPGFHLKNALSSANQLKTESWLDLLP